MVALWEHGRDMVADFKMGDLSANRLDDTAAVWTTSVGRAAAMTSEGYAPETGTRPLGTECGGYCPVAI